MTCIVGLEQNGKVYLGGDSCSGNVTDYNSHVVSGPKVFKKDNFIFGYTTSFRFGQLIQYTFEIPKKQGNQSDLQYLHNDFVDGLKNLLFESKYSALKENVISGGGCLFGYNNKLYHLQSDFSILNYRCGYKAIGCGEDIAMGALYNSQYYPPTQRVLVALEAAEEFSAHVRAPFHIIEG